MKNAILIFSALLVLSSCDVTIIDEAPYDPRDIYLGRYQAEEYSETFDLLTSYNMRVIKDADPFSNVIYFRNFYDLGLEVFAEIIGERVNIPRQVIDGYVIQGSGRYEFGELRLAYSVEDGFSASGVADFCSTVLYRR